MRPDIGFDLPLDRAARATPEARGIMRDEVRLLVSTAGGHEHVRFHDLPRFLPRGALLVVNRSATLPASVPATGRHGPFVLNLSTHYGRTLWLAEPRWNAARPGPLPIQAGETFEAAGLPGRFIAIFPALPRLWFVDLDADLAMGFEGEPIRYAYLDPPYPPLPAYQTLFATVPRSAEMPSAARPFTPRVVDGLRRNGIRIAAIELHTGVSSLEFDLRDADSLTLYPEPFRVPAATAAAVNRARSEGRSVIAVGTTVVRALESAVDNGLVRAAEGFTRLVIHPRGGVNVVDGLLTGLHDPNASHLAMLRAIAGIDHINAAYAEALRGGYLWHEFGDSHLILPNPAAGR